MKPYKITNPFNQSKYFLILIFISLIVLATSSIEQVNLKQIQIKFDDQDSSNSTWQTITVQQAYPYLNQQIQSLDDNFISHFIGLYHIQKSRLLKALNDQTMASQLKIDNIKKQPGNYLLLLAKMYLYNILPKSEITGSTWSMYSTQSRYLLAYFYFKVAAQRYQNAQAYYYLAVLDYFKLTPHQTFIKNLQRQIHRVSENEGFHKVNQLKYNQLLDYLRNQRFMSVEHNLFMSSMIGHHGASLVLGNMFKQGLGLDKNYKNCTTALSYYLSVVKETYVDFYQFRSSYSDEKNFQKELYSKKRVVFQNQQNVDVVSSSQFFDSQTIKAMYELADNYFIGKNGFKKNYVKAAQLFSKLAAQDHKNSMAMLAMCYFKGQGVPLDRKRARVLFQHSSKVSISEAMLIVMDYFEIQTKGKRTQAIAKMIEIYEKKKDSMNSILKYLFANLVIKGDVPGVKIDDAVVLLVSAAKEGHLMAKISMGLLFADGIDVSYDCKKAVDFFSQQAISHPFFMDKFYVARFGLKNQLFTFSLIKYLELSMVGDTNSFINALYILQIENQKSLQMSENSWNIKIASQNSLYKMLKQQRIVPDIYSLFQKQYKFMESKPIKYSTLQRLFEGSSQVLEQHIDYLKKKIIKVCAITKENSLMNFYEYKRSKSQDIPLLKTISNGSPDKLHVLESRYLLGQHYHKKYFESKDAGRDYTKQQYKAIQQYKRATSSPVLGRILYYIEQIRLSEQGIDFSDQMFSFGFVDDFLTYTFVLSIIIFVLYYKRSKKLDQIHRKELQKREQEMKLKEQERRIKQQQDLNRRFSNMDEINLNEKQKDLKQKEMKEQREIQRKKDVNQPQIIQQRQIKGYRIGGSQEQVPLILEQIEEYKYQQTNINQEEQKQQQQSHCQMKREQ